MVWERRKHQNQRKIRDSLRDPLRVDEDGNHFMKGSDNIVIPEPGKGKYSMPKADPNAITPPDPMPKHDRFKPSDIPFQYPSTHEKRLAGRSKFPPGEEGEDLFATRGIAYFDSCKEHNQPPGWYGLLLALDITSQYTYVLEEKRPDLHRQLLYFKQILADFAERNSWNRQTRDAAIFQLKTLHSEFYQEKQVIQQHTQITNTHQHQLEQSPMFKLMMDPRYKNLSITELQQLAEGNAPIDITNQIIISGPDTSTETPDVSN